MELGSAFSDILTRMDSGWQERPGSSVILDGRGLEWGRDWRIWCANLKQGTRYKGVVVEVLFISLFSITYEGPIFTVDEFTRVEIVIDSICRETYF